MANVSMSRRTIALIASVVLAAIATIAIVSYLRGVENEVRAEGEPVDVFVAKDTIPAGTSGDSAIAQALIEPQTIPRSVAPLDAIISLDEIRGRVAAVTIFPNETILAPRFVAPGQAGGALTIPDRHVAMSVEVDVPPGVAGFVKQGDRVSLIAHLIFEAQGANQSASIPVSKFVVQDAEVLAVGRRVVVTTEQGQEESTQQGEGRILFTLAVTPAEAERIAFVINEGSLYFTLQPEDSSPVNTPGRDPSNILPR